MTGGRWAIATVVCVLLLVAGGVITWRSFADSPASGIAATGRIDHARAVKLARHPATTPGPVITGSSTARAQAARSSASHVPATVSFTPTVPGQVASLTIPALGVVSAPVLREEVSKGYLDIPAHVHNVGWDDQTPTPGGAGITLLAGHVNWVGQGEGSMGEIGQLVPGDQVYLDWGGTVSTWVVTTTPVLSPNTEVHQALFSDSGPPRLALVTCGGPFSETASGGSYADNVIVEAAPAAT